MQNDLFGPIQFLIKSANRRKEKIRIDYTSTIHSVKKVPVIGQ